MSNDKDNSTDKIIAAKKGNVVVDLDLITSDDDNAEFIMLDSDEGNEILRHSSAHIMAQAVLEIFPEALFTIGPPIENGFYYDIDLEKSLSLDDLVIIEKR